jgi:hypothetical protein
VSCCPAATELTGGTEITGGSDEQPNTRCLDRLAMLVKGVTQVSAPGGCRRRVLGGLSNEHEQAGMKITG